MPAEVLEEFTACGVSAKADRQPALPPSVLSCVPLLWSRVLFPGRAARPGSWRWPALLLLILLPGLALYPCLSFYLLEPDEGRYAEIPREMLERGEWVIPYLQGEPYLDKPPLLYWLVMISYALLGAHDWSARLPPGLAVHACVLLTYLLGRRCVGARAAFWGALTLALAPGFLGMGRLLLHDGVLSLWTTLALFAAFEAVRGPTLRRGWWLTAAAACALGILTKGPVILLLLLPPLWLQRRLTGSGARVGWRYRLEFAALVLAVALPWYAAVCLRRPDFARHFLWEHNVVRFVLPFDHKQPVWFYGPILLLGLLPTSLLLIPFLRFLLSPDRTAKQQRSPELGFLLLAGGWCVLFFSLSGCKLPTYILPAFPPLCLALGSYLAGSTWGQARTTKVAAALSYLLLLLAHYVALPRYAREHSPMNPPAKVFEWCRERSVPVVCYPRSLDSVAFYLGRDDLRSYRSKATPQFVHFLGQHARSVVLCSHRHSLEQLRQVLPPGLQVIDSAPLGVCAMAVIEQVQPTGGQQDASRKVNKASPRPR